MPDRHLDDIERLRLRLRAEHPCITILTHEEDEALHLAGEAILGQTLDTHIWSASRGLRDFLVPGISPTPNTEHPAAALYHLTTTSTKTFAVFLDLIPHLTDQRTMRMFRDVVGHFARTGSHLLLIENSPALPPAVAALATRFDLSLPDEAELERLLRETVRQRFEKRRVSVELNKKDLAAFVRNLGGLTRRQARQILRESMADDDRLDSADVLRVLAHKRRLFQSAGALEYVEAPVSMADIGGLQRLKSWLDRRNGGMSDEARNFGISPPRGLLMLGVQGAGKSLSCKAVATAWQRPLIRLDVGALYDKYVGESERRLREAFDQAEAMAPIVLWIDEIEKAFASAGSSTSNDGGLSRRMFGSLLTWMQEHQAAVFTVATANDVSALPPELLRKGRFDEIFFVDLPKEDARRQILEIHLRKRRRAPASFDLPKLAAACQGFSGAEIEQAIISALYDAFSARTELTNDHLLTVFASSPPLSVTMAEQVQELRHWATTRCVPAD
jgi:SpoVK/Ycf46/Vps4 family AAA+-type ATPase